MPIVLSASVDKTAKIWDISTGERKQTLSGHGGAVNSAVFSADGSRIRFGTALLESASRHCLDMAVVFIRQCFGELVKVT